MSHHPAHAPAEGAIAQLLLLGSRNADDGSLSPVAEQKCRVALRLLERHSSCRLLATGGTGEHFNRTQRPHWHYVHDWFVARGVSRARLPVGVDSYNTLDDAVFSRQRLVEEALDPRSVRIVTCAYHADRARWIFGRVFGPDVPGFVIAPDPPPDPSLAELIAHEQLSRQWHAQTWPHLLEASLARLAAHGGCGTRLR